MAPPVAVTVKVPAQPAVVPTPALPQARVETVAVPAATPVPDAVFEPTLPTAGVTVAVMLTAPVAVGVNALTVTKLQLTPEASTWFAVHAPELGAA
jgi:hypothetical protein